MEVVVVDEERYFAETVQSILEIAGFKVRLFSEASTALQWLSDMSPPKNICVLVDVALAPGKNQEVFDEEKTEKFLTTGIVLCRTLFAERPLWKSRASSFVLYSAHVTTELWTKINEFAEAQGVGVWQKNPSVSGAEIVELVKKHLGVEHQP